MLAELLFAVEELAAKKVLPKVFKPDAEPEHIYYLALPNGQTEQVEANPEPRAHQVYSLEAFADFLDSDEQRRCEVWFSRQAVTVLLNPDSRRDRLVYRLTTSPQLKLLMGLEKAVVRKGQRDFYQMLRINLHDCLGTTGALLSSVKNLSFRQQSQTQGVVQHGKQSLGKAIESELTGAGTIPETVVIDTPIFENIELVHQHIKCAVDIDPATETFALIPLPGEIEKAIRQAEAIIGSRLVDLLPEATITYGDA